MHKTILFSKILLLQIIICCSFQESSENKVIDKITFYYYAGGIVHFAASIPCSSFEETFKGEIDSLNCTIYKERIMIFLETMKISDYTAQIDTRSKMYIYYKSNKVDTLCFGYTGTYSLNGINMESINNKSRGIIDSLCKL